MAGGGIVGVWQETELEARRAHPTLARLHVQSSTGYSWAATMEDVRGGRIDAAAQGTGSTPASALRHLMKLLREKARASSGAPRRSRASGAKARATKAAKTKRAKSRARR